MRFNLSRESVISDAYTNAIKEMYLKAQPPLDLDVEDIVDDSEDPTYNHHYLSEDEMEYIVNKYMDAYHIKNDVCDVCDMIIGLIDGGYDIGIKSLDKELFEGIKEKFKRCGEVESFRASIYLGPSPTSNKDTVVEYWKSKGVELEITEHDKELFWENDMQENS